MLNGNRVGLKSHISSDGFRTPNVQLVWGESGWVDFVDNGIRYGLFQCNISVNCIVTVAKKDSVLHAHIACLREKYFHKTAHQFIYQKSETLSFNSQYV